MYMYMFIFIYYSIINNKVNVKLLRIINVEY